VPQRAREEKPAALCDPLDAVVGELAVGRLPEDFWLR